MRAPNPLERFTAETAFFFGWTLMCAHFGWIESWATFWRSGVWWGGELMSGIITAYAVRER